MATWRFLSGFPCAMKRCCSDTKRVALSADMDAVDRVQSSSSAISPTTQAASWPAGMIRTAMVVRGRPSSSSRSARCRCRRCYVRLREPRRRFADPARRHHPAARREERDLLEFAEVKRRSPSGSVSAAIAEIDAAELQADGPEDPSVVAMYCPIVRPRVGQRWLPRDRCLRAGCRLMIETRPYTTSGATAALAISRTNREVIRVISVGRPGAIAKAAQPRRARRRSGTTNLAMTARDLRPGDEDRRRVIVENLLEIADGGTNLRSWWSVAADPAPCRRL